MFAKRPQASAKRPQASAKRPQSVRKASAKRPQSVRKHPQASAEGRTCRRNERDENRREMQNHRHFLRFLALQKCQQPQGSGGSWSRNPELSSLLDSSRVFASQKCQQSQGSGGSWWRNAELSSLLDSSRVFASQKCQQSQGSGKRRTVVTFGLASGLHVSKV